MKESRKRKALEEMDVMDDFMITELASHPTEGKKFARTLLSVLLQRKIGDITVHAQSVFQGDTPELRGIRLDVEITENIDRSPEEGECAECRIYDVEAQNREVVELPELEYKDGLKYIYFYTKGKNDGNKEISTLLSYLQHSIIENVKDEATQSIHDAVGYSEGRVDGIYAAFRAMNMPDEEIIQKLMDMCGISREEAIEYVDGQASTEER